jgi:hypothetical protein
MGKISKEIKKNLLLHINKKVVDIAQLREAKQDAAKSIEAIQSLRNEFDPITSDPLHHAYVSTYSLVSLCMYGLVNLKEMASFKKISMAQEDLYMPSAPPMSPLTDSYYQSWECFDLTFGTYKETLATIFLDLADVLKISQSEIDLIKILSASRMGVYKVCKIKDKKIFLKELVTNDEFWCVCPAGYEGEAGQLWYARVLPPPTEYLDYINYSIVMTTPYVLLNSNEKNWNDFFSRNNVDKNNYHTFMKFGPSFNYWHEFVFYGYSNFIKEAVFLSGIPDIESTLPHHEKFSAYEELSGTTKKPFTGKKSKKSDGRIKSINTCEIDQIRSDDLENLPPELNGRKVSEVFLDYAMPMIENFVNSDTCNLNELQEILRIPWIVWNSCVWESSKKNFSNSLTQAAALDKELQAMVNFFEERKKNEFKNFNYLMGEYQIIPKGKGEFNLRMESKLP